MKNEISYLTVALEFRTTSMSVSANFPRVSSIQQILSNIWVASGVEGYSSTFADEFKTLEIGRAHV